MTVRVRTGADLRRLANLTVPMALRVAATLRLADHIAEGAVTAKALAAAANADPDALARVMRHLVAAEVFALDAAGRYVLTPAGEALRDGHPEGMRAILDIGGALGRSELSLTGLLHSVRTGEAAYPRHYGRSLWDDLAADDELAASFDALMAAKSTRDARAVVSGYAWGTLGHVVDVGGGNGSLLAELLTAHPGLRGTLVERPGPAEAAARTLNAAGLAGRAEVVHGSFFDPLPRGAGGYLLCDILHDWNDDDARAILRQCAQAAGTAGSVFVVERTGSSGLDPSTGLDLLMLAVFGGRERDATALAGLAAPAGLAVTAVHAAGPLSIAELTPPRDGRPLPAA